MKNYMTRFQAALPLYLSLSGFFPLSFFLSAQIRQENKNDWENWIKESFIENGKCKERKNERKKEWKKEWKKDKWWSCLFENQLPTLDLNYFKQTNAQYLIG